jgi:hypothetical protein
MNLSEFINKRLNELGRNRNWLVNFGDLEWSTLSNIDKGLSIRKVTQEKLANALGCTQGDIQACLAEQNPLKNVIVNKKSLAKLNAKKEAPAPDPKEEEPAEVFKTDEPEDEEFPVYHSVYEEDRQEGEERYKQKLREMCLRIFASGVPGVHPMEKIYADIGYALVKELAQGGDNE